MADEWGPWIEHDGKGCPVGAGTRVQVVFDNGSSIEGVVTRPELAQGWDRRRPPSGGNEGEYVNLYRIRKPRGLTILEEILADLPEKVDA